METKENYEIEMTLLSQEEAKMVVNSDEEIAAKVTKYVALTLANPVTLLKVLLIAEQLEIPKDDIPKLIIRLAATFVVNQIEKDE